MNSLSYRVQFRYSADPHPFEGLNGAFCVVLCTL